MLGRRRGEGGRTRKKSAYLRTYAENRQLKRSARGVWPSASKSVRSDRQDRQTYTHCDDGVPLPSMQAWAAWVLATDGNGYQPRAVEAFDRLAVLLTVFVFRLARTQSNSFFSMLLFTQLRGPACHRPRQPSAASSQQDSLLALKFYSNYPDDRRVVALYS